MPAAPDLIKLVFLSGKAPLNEAVLNHFAGRLPELPLYVVAEFKPDRGVWIPWHVKRGFRRNKEAIEAVLDGRRIQSVAIVLESGTGLARMRTVAVALAPARLIAYDEDLNVLRWRDLPAWLLRRAKPGPGTERWLRRIIHPAEAEIPIRARLAQLKGQIPRWGRLAICGRLAIGPKRHQTSGITVIVPSRDGRKLLELMLPPLLSQLSNGEIIVVDNGSTDQTESWLKSEYPEIRVVVSTAPLSFAKAINAGLSETQYHRTLLLNNDMLLEPGFIKALETAFERIHNLFCATAQIFFPPGIRREETGKAVWRRENPLDFPVRCDDPIPGEDLTWVLYGSGGCSLFDTAKLLDLGGVPEVYDPAYVEDMDIGYRAWKRGWASVFCAGARVEHRHRATTSRFFTASQIDFFVERNYLRFLIHAIGSQALFRQLWSEAIRRLQLLSQLDALRGIPSIGGRPPEATGILTEPEILALGNGDIAVFPGRADFAWNEDGRHCEPLSSVPALSRRRGPHLQPDEAGDVRSGVDRLLRRVDYATAGACRSLSRSDPGAPPRHALSTRYRSSGYGRRVRFGNLPSLPEANYRTLEARRGAARVHLDGPVCRVRPDDPGGA